jgi:endonuclease/exonuclease/phosphatase family metal-dependent hydrolase
MADSEGMKVRLHLVMGMALGLGPACSTSATVATFNIRFFPEPSTDVAAVAQAIAASEADALAVQEIHHADAFEAMLQKASSLSGRDYRLVRGPCGGDGSELTTGVVYDAERWKLVASRGYPDLGRGETCGDWLPATVAILGRDGRRLAITSIHFKPFPHQFEERRRQWEQALDLLEEIEREYAPASSIMAGDANSTGFIGEPPEEVEFVRSVVAESGRELSTSATDCSAYWHPENSPTYRPSMLDHIVSRGGRWEAPTVMGMCSRLACEPVPADDMDPEFASISDHCPVVIKGRL